MESGAIGANDAEVMAEGVAGGPVEGLSVPVGQHAAGLEHQQGAGSVVPGLLLVAGRQAQVDVGLASGQQGVLALAVQLDGRGRGAEGGLDGRHEVEGGGGVAGARLGEDRLAGVFALADLQGQQDALRHVQRLAEVQLGRQVGFEGSSACCCHEDGAQLAGFAVGRRQQLSFGEVLGRRWSAHGDEVFQLF